MAEKNKFIWCLFCIVMFLPTGAFAQSQAASAHTAIDNPDFKKVVDRALSFDVDTISVPVLKNLTSDYIIFDARELSEYNTSHIKDAKFLGYNNFDKNSVKNIVLDTPIIVYCSIGYRSEKIGKKLKKMGFTNVKNLYGSIFEWANQGNDLYNQNELLTTQIHGYNKRWSRCIDNKELDIIY